MVKKTFEWIGHILAGLIVLYAIFYGSKTDLIAVSLLLGLCHLARTYLAVSQASLYSAIVLLSLSYLLVAERLFGISSLALCWLLPFFIIQSCGPDPFRLSRLFCRQASPEDQDSTQETKEVLNLTAPLAISTRMVSAALVVYLLWNQDAITAFYLVVIPLVLIALYDLRLTFHYQNSWYLFSVGMAFASAYYFFLENLVSVPVTMLMALLVALALIFLIAAFFLSRRKKGYADGFFAAAFTIAVVAIAVVILTTFFQNRIEPLQPVADTAALQTQPVPFAQLTTTQDQPASPGLVVPQQDPASNLGGVLVFLAAALIVACMRTKYDRNEFVYMLVMLLGLLGYFFIVFIEDPLYRSLINYLVYGLLVLGIYFVYVLIRGFFNVSWSLAGFLSQHYTRILYAFIPVALILIYFLFDYTMAVTENSHFCGACHLMKVQFDSWKKDKHSEKGVTCFDCHYSPGVKSFVKGRTSGVVMVVKNFTGLSKSKFPATVSDASCNKCHMDGTLKDRPKLESWITYKKDIRFNHKVMVHQKVSGIDLTCTSCHNHYQYDPESSHLFTPEAICYSCHLMKRKQETGTAVGNCYTCHYQESIEKDLDRLVTIGNGGVTRDKCLQCHWDADRFDDAEYQHKVHVSDYQDFTKPSIGCLDCHERIQHGDLTKLINP